ncbi:hypothetical protein KEM54_001976 [Ascosphaera aggregata]|nr:hypothetical protein KEM54_001976 [Ascosphaera aggregata]
MLDADIKPSKSITSAKKRRHDDESSDKPASNKSTSQDTPSAEAQSKRKKQKRMKKDHEQPDRVADVTAEKATEMTEDIDESIGKMNGPLLADFFAKQTKRHNRELTDVELNDMYIPGVAFKDTSSYQEPRNLSNLASFLEKQLPKEGKTLSVAPEENGTPHTLTKDCAVAKLFAKHIKLKEAKSFVQNIRIGVGVGTPARINDLVAADCLKLNHLERIVIDGSHLDQKRRGIFDMKEIFLPLISFLTRPELVRRYTSLEEDHLDVLVF